MLPSQNVRCSFTVICAGSDGVVCRSGVTVLSSYRPIMQDLAQLFDRETSSKSSYSRPSSWHPDRRQDTRHVTSMTQPDVASDIACGADAGNTSGAILCQEYALQVRSFAADMLQLLHTGEHGHICHTDLMLYNPFVSSRPIQ
jgi:hypothetical protein